MGVRRSSRYDKRDQNEKDIIGVLRQIPGVMVEEGHDDIIVGYKRRNYWFEIKNPSEVDKNGAPYAKTSKTAKKQKKLSETWTGMYAIVTTLDQILEHIGISK